MPKKVRRVRPKKPKTKTHTAQVDRIEELLKKNKITYVRLSK